MTEPVFREYKKEDIPALTSLWHTTFGDSEALIAEFFRLLPEMGSGVVAEVQGKPVGAAYIVTGFCLVSEGQRIPLAYLYAVAVDESCRSMGLGRILSRKAAELGRSLGAELITTLPAEPGLYPWYEKALGLSYTQRRKAPMALSELPEGAKPIAPVDYARLRETLLMARAHIELSSAAMEFEYHLCKDCGGGFYELDGSIFAAYKDGDVFSIREYLPEESCGEESDYVMSDRPLPENCIWNLTFD